MGKGSAPRPYSVPKKEFDNAFDRIFGKKEEKKEQEKQNDDPGRK